MVTLARVQALIASATPVKVTYNYLGGQEVIERYGVFTGVQPDNETTDLSSQFVDGTPTPTLVQLQHMTSIEEL